MLHCNFQKQWHQISFHWDTSVCVTIIAVVASTVRIRLDSIIMQCNYSVWVHFCLLRILFSWMLSPKGPLWLFGNQLVEIIKFTLFELLCIVYAWGGVDTFANECKYKSCCGSQNESMVAFQHEVAKWKDILVGVIISENCIKWGKSRDEVELDFYMTFANAICLHTGKSKIEWPFMEIFIVNEIYFVQWVL